MFDIPFNLPESGLHSTAAWLSNGVLGVDHYNHAMLRARASRALGALA
jgi:hypothetical protein